jgi:hypothetical protein
MYATDKEVVIPLCSACGLVEDGQGQRTWSELGAYLDRHALRSTPYKLIQTYCPGCLQRYYPAGTRRKGEDHLSTESAGGLTRYILSTVRQHPSCTLDMLVQVCPEFTWNQIFLEVDRLSRTGDIELSCTGPGRYNLVTPAAKRAAAPKLV